MKNILLVFFSIIAIQLFAQSGNVKGQVNDELSQKPVSGAVINVVGTNLTTTTDAAGSFAIENVPYGKYTIEIKEGDHQSYTQPLEVKSAETIVGSVGLHIHDSEIEKEVDLQKELDENPQTSTLSENNLEEIGSQSTSAAVGFSDPFISTASYVFGASRFAIRGGTSDQLVTNINGIPMNDPQYYGGAPQGSWSGLYQVFRDRSITLGLSPNENSFGGILGSDILDGRASVQREGLSVSYSHANRLFSNRLMATYASGMMKGGWAVVASLVGRWSQEGYVPGTFQEGYSYYFSVDKKFGNNNTLSFSTYGTPTRTGRALATTMEAYDLAGSHYYNPGWGYQNGVVRNAYVTNNFRPSFILNDEWKINEKSNLILAAQFAFGKLKSSGLDWNSAQDPLPDYYKNMPSYVQDTLLKDAAQRKFSTNVNSRQINWDNLYDINIHASDSIANVNGSGQNQRVNDSRYIIGDRVRDQKLFTFNTIYNTSFNSHIKLSTGLTYQFERVENYKQVEDLLGGSYYLDVNTYAQLSYPGNDTVLQNNLKNPNHLVTVGDKYNYDYINTSHRGLLWVQPQFHYKHLDFFVGGELSFTSFWRNGLFQDGLYPTSSLGRSAMQNFIDYAFKAGLKYKFNANSSIYANVGYSTQAPYIDDVFMSPDTRNQVVSGLKNAQIFSAEAGYIYRSSRIKARATLFYTQINNQTRTLRFYDDNLYTTVNYSITGINTQRIGGEGAIDIKIYKGFSARVVASLARYIYSSNQSATITEDNTSAVVANNETVYVKDFNLANTPQMAYSFGLSYHSPQFWYVSVNFNYFDWMWAGFNPDRRTTNAVAGLDPGANWNQIVDQQRLPSQYTMNLLAGYSWRLNNDFKSIKGSHKYYLKFNLSVNNLTNNTNNIIYGQEQLRFDYNNKNVNTYPPKYGYMYGATYMLTVAFLMN